MECSVTVTSESLLSSSIWCLVSLNNLITSLTWHTVAVTLYLKVASPSVMDISHGPPRNPFSTMRDCRLFPIHLSHHGMHVCSEMSMVTYGYLDQQRVLICMYACLPACIFASYFWIGIETYSMQSVSQFLGTRFFTTVDPYCCYNSL